MKRRIQILFLALTVPAWAETEVESEADGKLMAARYQFSSPEMYVDTLQAKMQMNEERICPFGFPQLDEEILAQANQKKQQRQEAKVQDGKGKAPLDEIIKQIPVNAVFAKRGVFFSGNRIVRKGQTLRVAYNGKPYNVLVSEIGSGGIIFKDAERNQKAIKKLNITSKKISRKYDKSKLRQKVHGFSNSQKPLRLDGGNQINLRKQQ